jgi:DNA-binding Xre family transcriptional regulator
VAALHKQGDRTDVNNYRPITILSTISNIFERARGLLSILRISSLLPERSLQKNSLVFEQIDYRDLASMDAGKVKEAAIPDLNKLCDTVYTVEHGLLLHKLTRSGVSIWSGERGAGRG